MNILINYLGKSNVGPLIAYSLAEGLAQNGNNVYAILSNSISNKKEWESNKQFKGIFFLDTYNNKCDFIISFMNFFVFKRKKIRKYFSNIQFDIIINPMFHMWSGFICDLFNSIPIVSVCHDPIPHNGASKIGRILQDKFILKSNIIVVLTKKFKAIISDRYGFGMDRILYMPLGRIDYYKKIESGYELEIANKPYKYLFFGRIEPYKGLDLLLKAYKKISEEFDDVELIVAGKGDISKYSSLLKDLPNVYLFNSYISDCDVGNFFKNGSIVVLPYISATQSGVIPIALEYENIIIASKTGGLMEQLDDGQVGLFFSSGNVEELYAKMKEVHENRNRILENQKNKMQKINEKMSWEKITKELIIQIKEMNLKNEK